MAKKTTTTSSGSNYSLVKVCAFIGVILSGVAGIISFILALLAKIEVTIGWGSKISGICSMIAQLVLFISVWLAAYDYVRNKSKTWKIIYFIFLVLGILGLVGLGLNSLL
jgi:hypothetical protein